MRYYATVRGATTSERSERRKEEGTRVERGWKIGCRGGVEGYWHVGTTLKKT
jgi:hypothetical protein